MQHIPITGNQLMEHALALRNVLSYGHDTTLLQTRQYIVERAGYRFIPVMQESAFTEQLSMSSPALIVLCQTLTAEECSTATRLAAEQSPSSPLLLVYTRSPKCVPERQHVLFETYKGPAAFFETVVQMVSMQKVDSTAGNKNLASLPV